MEPFRPIRWLEIWIELDDPKAIGCWSLLSPRRNSIEPTAGDCVVMGRWVSAIFPTPTLHAQPGSFFEGEESDQLDDLNILVCIPAIFWMAIGIGAHRNWIQLVFVAERKKLSSNRK